MNWFRVAQPVILAWGWRRAAIACLAGAASTLAMAPIDFWPALFVTFPLLVWLIDGAAAGRWGSVGAAFLTGWWFGFGYFLAGLYWVGYAFLVDAKTFGWLLPIAVTILPAGLALFTGFGFALARRALDSGAAAPAHARRRSDLQRMAARPRADGISVERPRLCADVPAGAGPERFGGRHLGPHLHRGRGVCEPGGAGGRGQRQALGRPCSARWPCSRRSTVFGAVRLALNPTDTVEGVRLRIMQPNLQQDVKFNYGAKNEVMRRYVALSERVTGPGARSWRHHPSDLAGIRVSVLPHPRARRLAAIAAMLPADTVLITGAARAAEPVPGVKGVRAYNSIYVIDHDGSILSIYDKVHLVPFGEYLPFQDFLERLGLMQLTKVQGGFLAGERRRRAGGAGRDRRCSRCICYEVIFPGEAVPRGRAAGLAPQRHQRRLVRHQLRAVSAPCSRRACAPSRRGCRWCARPTAESRR